jgi:Tol biopolymer transport system component
VAGTTARVSVYNGGFEGDGDSFRPALSADGRLVAFDSNSFNLAWGDPDEGFDVYVYDRQADVLQPASVDDAGNLGDDTSLGASISSEGRFVAYSSVATDLVPGDQNGASDIMLFDRQSGATTRLSVANSGDEANADSLDASISADGTLVAYQSDATNLVAGDTNRRTDIFVRDTTANPPPPPVPCVVPRVVGLRLAAAKKRITRAHCAVGRVRRVRAARRRAGRVVSQSPRAGTRRPAGAKVNLVVGRR